MIFTSNYARHGNDPNAVAISVRPPSWYTGRRYKLLSPTWEMVNDINNGRIDELQYAAQYMELLETRKLTAEQVIADVGENAILLCYEKPGDFCHRRLVAAWIKQETGIVVPEKYFYDNESKLLNDLFEF